MDYFHQNINSLSACSCAGIIHSILFLMPSRCAIAWQTPILSLLSFSEDSPCWRRDTCTSICERSFWILFLESFHFGISKLSAFLIFTRFHIFMVWIYRYFHILQIIFLIEQILTLEFSQLYESVHIIFQKQKSVFLNVGDF